MTYMIKISLVGLSGAGKTTTLKQINPSAFIMDTQVRNISELEAEAWKKTIGTQVPTTTVPNFTHVVVNDEGEFLRVHNGIVGENEHIVHIIDTCGQEFFFNLTRDNIDESNGLLFIIDASIPILSQVDALTRAYANVMSNFIDYVPIHVCLNKQDILQRNKTLKEQQNGYDGKAEQVRPYLHSFLPELKEARFFNTSAELGWNIKEALESLIKNVMDNICQKVKA